jgi:hypothetical protein
MTFTGADHSDSIQQEPMEVKNEAQICLGARSAPGSQGSEMPTSSNNVSALVTKSKKAASSLFTLLHAKVSPEPISHQLLQFCHKTLR